MSKLSTIYFTTFILVFFSLPLLNLTLEHCQLSRNSESLLSALSIISICIFIVPFLIYLSLKGDEGKKYMPLLFVLFLSTAPTFFSSLSRQSQTVKNYWEFSGVVTDKYVSKNHAAKALKIGEKVYEPFPLKLWDLIKTGDVVEKRACSDIILINKKENKFRVKNI
jgi:hypothetical protein